MKARSRKKRVSAPVADTGKPPQSTRATRGARRHPIVGVGASAGGLEAFTELLKHLPADTGMGFVLVQHLDPQHESALAQILKRATTLPVIELTKDVRVKPDHVYIIPPNRNLGIEQGVLKLQPRPQTRTPVRSIDSFLESLAQDQRDLAIGVILSGTASDGTMGLEMIKAEGGITFAQDDTAKYDSMPRSAVSAGCVDFVLSPGEIARELARIAKHPFVAGQPRVLGSPELDHAYAAEHQDDKSPLPSGGRGSPRTGARRARAEAATAPGKSEAEGFRKILLLLHTHSGVDFSLYKSNTIQRRVARRIILTKQNTLQQYADFLRGNSKELDALYSDVLIGVTSFFRNPEAFDILSARVFPKLLQQRGDNPLRVWVLGCSTGQEAYSIAMSYTESAEKAGRTRKLQIFATDLNDALLNKARYGLYAKSLAGDISPERLRRFFVEEQGGYRIIKPLREMVVFARQNLISDPPFSRMDLISCRNMLIYLEPSLQQKAFPTFHYALKPEGFLFLGPSESIGSFTDLFEPVDKKYKIYSRKSTSVPAFHLPAKAERGSQPSSGRPREVEAPRSKSFAPSIGAAAEEFRNEITAQREADRVTVGRFAPPGVLVNANLQILQFRGPTGAFLRPPTGKASFDVLKMAREGLMLPLRQALNKAKKDNKPARRENVPVAQDGGRDGRQDARNGKFRMVHVDVIPLRNLQERCFLILFEEAEKAVAASPVERGGAGKTQRPEDQAAASRRAASLQSELADTRDYLQSVLEQHEAANEELQASHEEIQSANEELQSVNEELETSKEELESTNEELTTINEEMQVRNAELSRLNSDLINFQSSLQMAVVMLGRDLTIRRFSVQAEEQFGLLITDIGRPFGNVRHTLGLTDIEALINNVIVNQQEREREVQDKSGRWFSLRVHPYVLADLRVDGAVLVLVDIDELKRSQESIATAREQAEAVIRTVRDPLVILDAGLRIRTANDSFYRAFRLSAPVTEGASIFELHNGAWNIPGLRRLIEEILPRNSWFQDFELSIDFGFGRRTLLLNGRRLNESTGESGQILMGLQDITELKTADREVSERSRLLELSNDAIVMRGISGRILYWSHGAEEAYGWLRQDALGKDLQSLLKMEYPASFEQVSEQLLRDGRWEGELAVSRRDGGRLTVLARKVLDRDSRGEPRAVLESHTNITQRKQAENGLRLAQEQLANRAIQLEQLVDERTAELTAANKQLESFVYSVAHDLRAPLRVMQGFSEMLVEEADANLSEPGRDLAKKIQSSSRFMDVLLMDLLDLSRVSQAQLELAPVSLEKVIQSELSRLESEIQQKKASVAVEGPWPHVLAHGPLLGQVIYNLLGNALKFVRPDVPPQLLLHAEERDGLVRVWLEDNGIGIAPEHQEQIFRLFIRLNGEQYPGTGVGLPIVQKSVERMGGQVGLESTPGQGSRFWFELKKA